MQLLDYVTHVPLTKAAVFDGTADTELAEWMEGTVEPDPENPELFVIKWTNHLNIDQYLHAGEVIYRSEQMGSWSQLYKTTVDDFNKLYDPAVTIGFASQNAVESGE